MKENHPTLHREIAEYFEWAIQDEAEKHRLSYHHEKTFGHGRTTHWRVFSTKDTGLSLRETGLACNPLSWLNVPGKTEVSIICSAAFISVI